MKKYNVYFAWGALFIVCAGLGFIQRSEGLLKAVMVLFSAAFFVPPVILLYRGKVTDLKLVRNLSILSLSLTFALLVVNFLSIFLSEWMGSALYALLVIVSTPMVCSQYWAVSMFCWACLLFTAMHLLKKAGKN